MNIKNLHITLIFSLLFALSCVFFTLNSQSKMNGFSKRNYTVGYMKNLFSEVDLNDAQAALKVWMNEIVKTYNYSDGYNLKAKIYANYDELNNEMKHDSLAIIALNTYDYLSSTKMGLTPILVPSAGGDIFAQYYLLVRKDDKYKTIKDLKGSNIGVLSSFNQASSRLWFDIILSKNNVSDKANFFKTVTKADKESQLILNLFFGHLDACIVSKRAFLVMKELNPQIGDKIIFIQASPKYLWGVVSFTKTFINERDKNLFYTSAIHVHELVSGKQLFSLIKIDKLNAFKNEYLDSYKDLIKEYTYLVKTKKIKKDEWN
jgi:hypothetical protein